MLSGCKSCGADTHDRYARRGLCRKCESHHRRRGTLLNFPRITWLAEELVAEATMLLSSGRTRADVAAALGVQWGSILQARSRVRRRAREREESGEV